jgi:hypothetical protein
MSYGIIGWRGCYSKEGFYVQKSINRIKAAAKRRTSCRKLFKEFNILPLASEFMLLVTVIRSGKNVKISN